MFVEVTKLRVHYPGRPQAAVDGVSFGLARGRHRRADRPVGLRQDLPAARRGRARARQPPARFASTASSWSAAPALHVPPEERRIGMVFQDYALFPHLDVGHNVAFGIASTCRERRARAPRRRDARSGRPGRHRSAAARTSCPAASSSASRWPARWRRSRACCCSTSRSPTSTSTCASGWRTRSARILKAADATALFVTHDQLEAFAIGDVIGVMHEGRLAPVGRRLHAVPPAGHALRRRLHRPRRVRAGAPCAKSTTRSLVQTAAGRAGATSPNARCPSAFAAGECDVLLRADDIVHDDDAPVKAEIERKAFRGSEFLYTLRLASGETGAGPRAQPPRPPDRRMDRHSRRGRPRGDLRPRAGGLGSGLPIRLGAARRQPHASRRPRPGGRGPTRAAASHSEPPP